MPTPHLIQIVASVAAQLVFMSHAKLINEHARRLRRKAWAKTSETIRLALTPETPAIEVVAPPAIAAVNYEREEGEPFRLEPAPDPIFD